MRQYDGLYILDIQGKDEGLTEAIDLLEKAIKDQGGAVGGTQKMDKRKFERVAGKLDSGYYLNVQFTLEPAKLDDLRQHLASDSLVYRQFYLVSDGTSAPFEQAENAEEAAPAKS